MQTRKLSIFLDHILEASQQTGLSISNILDLAKNWGYQAFEINLDYAIENPQTITLIKNKGMTFSCIYNFYQWQKDSDFSKAQLHVDTAARLNAKKILVVPGFFSKEESELFKNIHDKKKIYELMDSLDCVKNITSMLYKTVLYAKEKNITVTLEDFDSETSPCEKIFQLQYFFERVPGLKFTFDCGNFAFSDEDLLFAFDTLKDHIVHLHLKDRGKEIEIENKKLKYNKGLASLATGFGYLPISKIVLAMEKLSYKDYFAIEHFSVKDQLTAIQKSAAFMESF